MRQVLDTVETAAKSPQAAGQAYISAYKNVKLAGKVTQAKDSQDWNEKNKDWLHSREFQRAAQLNLEYLALTLRRAASQKPLDFIEPSISYLKTLADAEKTLFNSQEKISPAQKELLSGSVKTSLFAEDWKLAPFLQDVPDWEWSPGNVEGILEKNIRKAYREKKDHRLLETWDFQLAMEQARFADVRKTHELENFRLVRVPTLQIRKATDRALLGETNQAAADAMKILAANQEHPSFETWVGTIRKWLDTKEEKSTSLTEPQAENSQ